MSGSARTWVALLRAVNLAGRKKVAMADLRRLLGELGLEDPRSLLQSGNLVFRASGRTEEGLATLLESEAERRLGLATDFFVRTAEEWRAIVQENPFPQEAEEDPSHLLVVVLERPPVPEDVSALQESIKGREVVRQGSRHVYITYPDGIGRSRLTSARIERGLGARGTGRNWNTVLKLAAAAGV